MKSMGTFIDDADLVSQEIERIVGESLDNVNAIDELQDEYDDLKDSEKALENMLSMAK